MHTQTVGKQSTWTAQSFDGFAIKHSHITSQVLNPINISLSHWTPSSTLCHRAVKTTEMHSASRDTASRTRNYSFVLNYKTSLSWRKVPRNACKQLHRKTLKLNKTIYIRVQRRPLLPKQFPQTHQFHLAFDACRVSRHFRTFLCRQSHRANIEHSHQVMERKIGESVKYAYKYKAYSYRGNRDS